MPEVAVAGFALVLGACGSSADQQGTSAQDLSATLDNQDAFNATAPGRPAVTWAARWEQLGPRRRVAAWTACRSPTSPGVARTWDGAREG